MGVNQGANAGRDTRNLDVEQQFSIIINEWEEHCYRASRIKGANIATYIHPDSFAALKILLENNLQTTLQLLLKYLQTWKNRKAPIPEYLLMMLIENVLPGFEKHIKGLTRSEEGTNVDVETLRVSIEQGIQAALNNIN